MASQLEILLQQVEELRQKQFKLQNELHQIKNDPLIKEWVMTVQPQRSEQTI